MFEYKEENPPSALKSFAIWVGLTYLFFTFIGMIKVSNIAFSIGFAIAPGAVAAVAFALTDRFENKTAARTLYVLCVAALIYFFYVK